ncbi:MAG: flagellar hook-basal body complex protein, partial [Acetobacterium sp.]|nr:flagellar hook-basal body complex protein [Acetobacterium sp.]
TKAPGNDWLTGVTLPADSNYTGDVKLAGGQMVEVDETAGGYVKGLLALDPTADLVGTSITLTKIGDIYSIANLNDKAGTPITDFGTPIVSSSRMLTFSKVPGLKIDTTKIVGDTSVGADIGDIKLYDDNPAAVATVTNEGGVVEYLRTPIGVTLDGTETTIPLVSTTTDGTLSLEVDGGNFPAIVTAGLPNTTIGKIETGSDKPVTLGYLALAKFANNDGLLQDGNGYFMESANSGEAIASKAGTNGTGGTESANLEMSNVDLSQEFTDMIVAQRGFQANSRIITVSDSILEELINLKR